MLYRVLADCVVLLHFAFVAFVVLGGLLLFRWPRVIWYHIPAVIWAVVIELTGWTCPLTPLENWLLARGGAGGYNSGFVEHYIIPALYPAHLTRPTQVMLGGLVIVVNTGIYAAWRWWNARRLR